jgi:hypothetical protein
MLSWLCKTQPFTMRIVGVLVVHVAGVVVFAAAGVGPNTTPVKVILEIAMGGRAFWAWANARGQSAEGETPASVHLSLLEEVGSVGAGTGKLGVVQLQLPAKKLVLGEPIFLEHFSREQAMVQAMVPW